MKQITEPITAQTRQPGGGGIASVEGGFVNPGQTEALDGACNPRCNQAPSWRYTFKYLDTFLHTFSSIWRELLIHVRALPPAALPRRRVAATRGAAAPEVGGAARR